MFYICRLFSVKIETYCKNNHINIIRIEDLKNPNELQCNECTSIEKKKKYGYRINKIVSREIGYI